MIEIGPNLKKVLLDFMEKNDDNGKDPGHLLKESFSKLLEDATEKAILDCANTLNNIIQEMPDKYESNSTNIIIELDEHIKVALDEIIEILNDFSTKAKSIRNKLDQINNKLNSEQS